MEWTKDAEIAWLKRAIKKLGPNSYLGPWLADNAVSIEHDIRSDFRPTIPLPNAAYSRAAEMADAAKKECEALLKDATAKRDKMLADAVERVEGYKATARAELRRLADRL